MVAWLRSSCTILGYTPLASSSVAQVCLRSWKRISGRPAFLSSGLNERRQRLCLFSGVPTSVVRTSPTPGALEALSDAGEHPLSYLARHAIGDGGELCGFDRHENGLALRHRRRVLSSYKVGEACVWVITEADRSVTTILLPEEY